MLGQQRLTRQQLVPEISGSVTVTSTFRYSNPATAYLTQTNSDGVVTGQPTASAGTQPAVVTTQPAVDTVPAGLTTVPGVETIPAGVSGTRIITYNGTAGITSFTVVGSNTSTTVLGGGVATGGSSGAAETTGRNGQTTGGRRPTGTNGGSDASGSASGTASSSTSTDNAAASNMHLASGGLIGLAALFAALL